MMLDRLPHHIAERVHTLADRPIRGEGEFVLCWLHHAVRGHENAALDAALELGNSLGVPALVYQGLGGRHRYNSDRHHRFILEGARDAHRQIERRGVRAVFHLPMDPHAPGPLRALAARAAVVVTEDFPAPPLCRWSRALAGAIRAPVLLVDCACIVPMRTVEGRADRAFRFRQRVGDQLRGRVSAGWIDAEPTSAPWDGELPFEPFDLACKDLDSAIAACEIDHAVAPVRDTPGGSEAGYERWAEFRRVGLRTYHRRRNNAADPDGVSRLSPYLHHGHVSALRIARDAVETGGEGAEKFIDELFVWRELAHGFCLRTDERELETIGALPGWARETMEAHDDDPRERVLSWESMARARSGNPLWDAGQRSLLARGWMHNNVRMTWGKAIPGWTRTTRDALARLIDLNHRYALDGSDPNSYGGLLWCLGQFDRPFTPERPVLGTVRGRPIEDNAERLDVGALRGWARTRPGGGPGRVAVIGAGMAGLAAARTLADHNVEVVVFDKGRAPGGRISSRRMGAGHVDHGARYFTARTEPFRRLVASWLEDGIVARWDGPLVRLRSGGRTEPLGDEARYVGAPMMRAVAAHVAADLDVRCGVRVDACRFGGGAWSLREDVGGDLGVYDAVIVTAPPAQAAALVGDSPALAQRAAGSAMIPCWAAMATFAHIIETGYNGVRCDDGPIAWAARDTSKPGRRGEERWTLHASESFSGEHLEADQERALALMLEAFAALVGRRLPPLIEGTAHRWRYARPGKEIGVDALFDSERCVAMAGDWLRGGRVEDAWLSGVAAAARVLSLRRERVGAGLFGDLA